ncbi:MAG TPA: C-type lectin domain-containing protein, partial [Kofleriaceae bacterium]|nr:C-type lectin domain-containing protein [Kofleriaceae bacterium]
MRWFAPVVAAAVAGAGCGRLDFHTVPADAPVPDAAPDAPIDTIDASLIDPCAATYTTVHGVSHYRFSGTAASWDIAEHACEADGRGSHLVVFNDSLEMNLVEGDVGSIVFWVGITDRVHDGTFIDV